MIAYNRQSLDNRDIQQQAAEALAKTVITQAEYDRIGEAYPFRLYTPNIFIRIGLFLLTLLIVACGLGLLLLIGMGGGDKGIAITLIFWGVAAYGGLELLIHTRGMYRSGVDDALLWSATSLICGGLNFLAYDMSPTAQSWVVLILAAWGVLRYADQVMALVAYGALISLIYHLTHNTIVVMAVSVIAYFLFARLYTDISFRHYRSCLLLLQSAALLNFYLSGNYYVVQNIQGETTSQALSWLWWSFTGIVPVVYIVAGIRKKDTILLWTGLALVAGAVFTVRYYYHILPAEVAMVIGGSILITAAYVLIRFLHTPKHGFTSMVNDDPHVLKDLPVESLVLAETFKSLPAQPSDQGSHFGGGSGGGAGAGGTY